MLGIRTVGDLLFSTCKALGLTSETEKKKYLHVHKLYQKMLLAYRPTRSNYELIELSHVNCHMLNVTYEIEPVFIFTV